MDNMRGEGDRGGKRQSGRDVSRARKKRRAKTRSTFELTKGTTVCLILAIITIILAFVTINASWWSIETDYEEGTEVESAHLDRWEVEDVEGDETTVDMRGEMEEVGDRTSLMISLSAVILFFVMITTIVGIILVHAGHTNFVGGFGMLIAVFAVIAFLLALAAPIYYGLTWPDAVVEDDEFGAGEEYIPFWGGRTNDVETRYSPDIGWFYSLGTAIAAGITLSYAESSRRELKRAKRLRPPKR